MDAAAENKEVEGREGSTLRGCEWGQVGKERPCRGDKEREEVSVQVCGQCLCSPVREKVVQARE